MKISIITATYNSSSTLEETINSLINQTHKDIEYIIVDSCSSDSTPSIIEKYKKNVSILICEKDNGIYEALNKGIEKATGDIIGILHSDDFYFNNNVLKEVAQAFEDKTIDALYGDLIYVNRKNTKKIIRKWKSGTYSTSSFLFGWMPPHPTFFVRKEVYRKFGAFNLSLRTSADYELMLRLLYKYKLRAFYLPKILIKMRVGGQSNITTRNRILANREDKKAWEINGLKPYPFTFLFKPLRKLTQFLK